MKKSYLILFAVAALICGCTQPATDTIPAARGGDEVSFKGTAAATESTRVSYQDGTTALIPAWEEGDLIGIFVSSGQSSMENFKYKALASGSTTDFSPAVKRETVEWLDDAAAHDFYAYYPYTAEAADPTAVPVSVPAVQIQARTGMEHLADCGFMYAAAKGVVRSENPVEFSFKNLFAVLEVQITANERALLESVVFRSRNASAKVSLTNANANLATGELTLTGAETSNQIRLDCNYKLVANEVFCARMVITPGHAGEEFEIVAIINGTEYPLGTRTVPAAGIPAGKTAVIAAALDVDEEDILPSINLSADGTANTYIVNAAGKVYRFNASVRGNGVAREYDLDGTPMYSYDNSSLRINPACALVLWYNNYVVSGNPWVRQEPLLVSSVTLKDGYVYFDTPEEFVNGNAVIAVFDKVVDYDTVTADANGIITNANILWSWNIWAVEDYDPATDEKRIEAGGFTIMDRNLGALIDGSVITGQNGNNGADYTFSAASSVGNYYQWGRKDPFPYFASTSYYTGITSNMYFTATYTPIVALQNNDVGSNNYGGSTSQQQIFLGTTGGAAYNTVAADLTSIENSILVATRNPHKSVNNTSANNNPWFSTTSGTWKSLWGNPTGEGYPDITTAEDVSLKSIYDPCPPGWKVWTNKAICTVIDTFEESATFHANQYGAIVGGSFFAINGGSRGGNTTGFNEYLNPVASGGTGIGTQSSASTLVAGSSVNMFKYKWNVQKEENKYAACTLDYPTVDRYTNTGSRSTTLRCMKHTEDSTDPGYDPADWVVDPEQPDITYDNSPQVDGMDTWIW